MRRWMMAMAMVGTLLLAGCSTAQYPDSEFLGNWQVSKGEQGGVTVSLEEIQSHITLTLEDSGSAALEIGAATHKGKWSPLADDAGIMLVVDDNTMTLTKIRKGALEGEVSGVTMTFEQEQGE